MKVETTLTDVCIPNGLQTGPFGSQLKAEEYSETGTPVVMPRDIIDGRIRIDAISRIPDALAIKLNRHKLHKGDLVFSRRGDLSKIAVVSSEEEGFICGTGCLRARPKSEHNPDYLRYLAQTKQIADWLIKNSVGQTMANLNTDILANLPLLIPKRSVQDNIVLILSSWDRVIDLTEQFIEAKQARRKWLMQQLLTGKKRLPWFNKAWHPVHLREHINEISIRNRDCSITQVLSVTNDKGFILPEEQFSRSVASSDLSNYKVVYRGQFAYNPSRINVGSWAMLNNFDVGVISPMYVVFEVNKSMNANFLAYWMQSGDGQQRINLQAQGSVRDTVAFDALASIKILLPKVEEQQAIINVLNTADRELELLRSQLEALREQKKGLMQQLLTGKVRVKI